MKTFMLVLLLSSLLIAPILASGADSRTAFNKSEMIQSLTLGVSSDNEGLRTSSAIVIKPVLDQSLIKPADISCSLCALLKMLDSGTTEKERIAAAVAI
jgi:hypothetical protein